LTTEHIFLAVLGAAGFWEIIKLILARIFSKKDKHDEKEDLQTLALQGLLHEALERRCLEALAYGQMTPAMHETIDALWEPYQRMGLNGTGRALHDKVMDLDISNE
jgi:hypothetical protein